jgi:hypothetical protein
VNDGQVSLSLKHTMEKDGPRTELNVEGNHAFHLQILSIFGWLSSAFRTSVESGVSYSSVSFEITGKDPRDRRIFMRPRELQKFRDYEIPCWHALLPHAVIAKGFPISDRKEGVGLEISFANMALLGQTQSFMELDGSLVLQGLRSFLIPTRYLPIDGALQWHFEYKRQPSGRKIPLSSIVKRHNFSDRYLSLNPQDFIERRCFLGWVEEAVTVIGTSGFSNTKLNLSDAEPGSRVRYLKSHSLSMGTGGLGFFGATGTRKWAPVAMPSRMTLPVDKDIYDTLADDQEAATCLFDTTSKTSWLLPLPSVILYIVHLVVHRRNYQLCKGGQRIQLKYAKPHQDGGAESTSVLRESLSYAVVKPGKEDDGDNETLAMTIRQIWNTMDMVTEKIDTAELEFDRVGDGIPKLIHGVEFNDIQLIKIFMEIKQVKVDQPWAYLAQKRCPVLFCEGLGQPIVPASPYGLCRS